MYDIGIKCSTTYVSLFNGRISYSVTVCTLNYILLKINILNTNYVFQAMLTLNFFYSNCAVFESNGVLFDYSIALIHSNVSITCSLTSLSRRMPSITIRCL